MTTTRDDTLPLETPGEGGQRGIAARRPALSRSARASGPMPVICGSMGVRAAKLAGGGCYRDGTVGADTRPVTKTEVSVWASLSS